MQTGGAAIVSPEGLAPRQQGDQAPHDGASDPPMSALLGIPFHGMTMDRALQDAETAMLRSDAAEPAYYVTANVDFCRLAAADPWLREFIFHADRILCDGLPLVWLAKLLGAPLPERVAGSDMVPLLLDLCARRGLSVYWFGSDEETLKSAADSALEKYPGLRIAGFESPPMGAVEDWDGEAIGARIRTAAPALLLVALGCPKQEQWIARNYRTLGVPLSIGVGASLDFIAGKQVRAPRWMRVVGMEWFWRMARSPRRLIGRYSKDLVFLAAATWRQWRAQRRSSKSSLTRSPWPRESHSLVWRGAVTWRRRTAIPGWGVVAVREDEDISVDAAGVTRIDAAGLGQLAQLARCAARSGARFALLRPSRAVRRAVRAMGFEDLLGTAREEAGA